jgi:hypothetical protein
MFEVFDRVVKECSMLSTDLPSPQPLDGHSELTIAAWAEAADWIPASVRPA